MTLHITTPPPVYPQATAQSLVVGEAIRYAAGNGVIRLGTEFYVVFDEKGKVTGKYNNARVLGHGTGDLLPTGTKIEFEL